MEVIASCNPLFRLTVGIILCLHEQIAHLTLNQQDITVLIPSPLLLCILRQNMLLGHILCRAVGTVNASQCDNSRATGSEPRCSYLRNCERVRNCSKRCPVKIRDFFSVLSANNSALISMMQCKNKQANKQQERFFVLMSCEKICDVHFETNVQRDWSTNQNAAFLRLFQESANNFPVPRPKT